MTIRLICLDADDTLWHNETYFRRTQAEFAALLAPFADEAEALARLEATEHGNLAAYGYGAKGFVLSMVEAALALGGGALPVETIARLLDLGKPEVGPVDLRKEQRPALLPGAVRG